MGGEEISKPSYVYRVIMSDSKPLLHRLPENLTNKIGRRGETNQVWGQLGGRRRRRRRRSWLLVGSQRGSENCSGGADLRKKGDRGEKRGEGNGENWPPLSEF